MAVVKTGNPLSVSAADVAAGPVVLWVGMLHIYQIEFEGATVATDTAQINDTLGRVVWQTKASTDLVTIRSGNIGWENGLVVPIGGITNGSLRVYIK